MAPNPKQPKSVSSLSSDEAKPNYAYPCYPYSVPLPFYGPSEAYLPANTQRSHPQMIPHPQMMHGQMLPGMPYPTLPHAQIPQMPFPVLPHAQMPQLMMPHIPQMPMARPLMPPYMMTMRPMALATIPPMALSSRPLESYPTPLKKTRKVSLKAKSSANPSSEVEADGMPQLQKPESTPSGSDSTPLVSPEKLHDAVPTNSENSPAQELDEMSCDSFPQDSLDDKQTPTSQSDTRENTSSKKESSDSNNEPTTLADSDEAFEDDVHAHSKEASPQDKKYEPRRYQCQFCLKKFARPSSLTTHVYSHTGEKPYQCPNQGCGRGFSVLSNLRRHNRVCQKNLNRKFAFLEMIEKRGETGSIYPGSHSPISAPLYSLPGSLPIAPYPLPVMVPTASYPPLTPTFSTTMIPPFPVASAPMERPPLSGYYPYTYPFVPFHYEPLPSSSAPSQPHPFYPPVRPYDPMAIYNPLNHSFPPPSTSQ